MDASRRFMELLRTTLIAVSLIGAVHFVQFVFQRYPRFEMSNENLRWWAVVAVAALLLNAIYLSLVTPRTGRTRNLIRLWMDAKEAELKKRIQPGP